MRRTAMIASIALAGCSPAQQANNQSDPSPATAPQKAAPSASQKAAVTTASDYLTALSRRDYKKAHAMWDRGGAASGGSVADLEHAYAAYSSFNGTAGEASEISTSSGMDRVVVTANAEAVMKKTGAKRSINGFVYLQRPAGKGEWKVWGVDIRRRG